MANNDVLTHHLRLQYELFGHAGYLSRCGSVDIATKQFQEIYCASIEEAIEYAMEWDGKRNVFISRDCFRAPNEVKQVSSVAIDIDSKREKDSAATAVQVGEALFAAKRIAIQIDGGIVAASGNGAYVLWKLPEPITDPEEIKKHYEKCKQWTKALQAQYPEVIIDGAINHPKALFKMLGTESTKGDPSLRRRSHFIDFARARNFRSSLPIVERLSVFSESALRLSTSAVGNAPKSRSEADFGLVAYLYKKGVSEQAARTALRANPLGRKDDFKDQERIIRKIYYGEGGASAGLDQGQWEPSSVAIQPPNFDDFLIGLGDSKLEGVYTGFTVLDSQLGPMPKGQLVGLAARSGFGKTSFSLAVTEYNRSIGKVVLYYPTEDKQSTILKHLAQVAMDIPKIELENPATLSESSKSKLQAYKEDFNKRPVYVNDTDEPSLVQIKADIEAIKPDLVVFDHINWMSTDYHTLAKLSKDLKILAKETGVVMMATAQMNEPDRNGKDGAEFTSVRSDVKGAKELINNSRLFMFLTRPYMTETDFAPVTLNIDKAHQNKKAYFTHDLLIDKRYSKIIEPRKQA